MFQILLTVDLCVALHQHDFLVTLYQMIFFLADEADEDALHRKAFRTERFNLIQNKL